MTKYILVALASSDHGSSERLAGGGFIPSRR